MDNMRIIWSDSYNSDKKGILKMKYEYFDVALANCGFPVSCFEKEKIITIPNFIKQYNFKYCNKREWRVDYFWGEQKLIVEIEGGAFISGGHNRGAGFRRDILKYNSLVEMGYTVMRFMPEHLPIQVKRGELSIKRYYAIDCIKRYFEEINND